MFEWETASPESQGMSSSKLESLRENLEQHGTKAFLVARNDRIVFEWYASDDVRTRGHYTASMAKAVVGGVSMAVAISDGRVRLDDRAADYIPQWRDDPVRSQITLRQLGSHTSGLAEAKPKDQGGWQETFWKRNPPPDDPYTVSRDLTPVIYTPGTRFHYSNPGIAMFDYSIAASLRNAPERNLRTLLRERIMRPIGAGDKEWSVGYNQTFEVDGLELVPSWGGGQFTARAAARIGRLMLREGDWDGQRLVSAEAVRATVSDAGLPGANGMGWWTNAKGRYSSMPRDAFFALGAEHQILLVVPSLNLIAVRNGQALAPRGAYADRERDGDSRSRLLFGPLMDAVERS